MKKMKIYHILIWVILLILVIVLSNSITNNIYCGKENKFDNNLLSIMIETGEASGQYEKSNNSLWPTGDYVFNAELSRCENGSTLNWIDAKKAVEYSGNLSDKCYIYFDYVPPVKLTNYITSKYTGTQGENGIYYHESNLTNGAGDNSYRFAGGDYQLTLKATSAGLKTVITSVKTASDGVINFYCNGTKQYVGFTCTSTYTRYYSLQYDTSNTQYQSYKEALAKAVADGYLTQNNIKNFVCFGTNESPCPTENLYRIIGVIDNKIKLIKYDYATSALLGSNGDFSKESDYKRARYYKGEQTISYLYHWNYNNDTTANNGKGSINWNTSLLNKINLNNNMLNNIGESWANKIATTNWIVGGNTWENINSKTAKEVYNNEIVNYSSVLSPTTYLAKIGLIYLSDYKYATKPEAWSETTVTIANRPWIYMGALYEYSITPNVQYNSIFNLDFVNLDPNAPASVRPVFSLLSSITYKSGNGTKDNPIFIN